MSLKLIADSLGGSRLLGKGVETPLGAINVIRHGLPAQSAFFLQNRLDVGDQEFSTTLGVSVKWLSRHRKEPKKHLDANVSDRLYRIARIVTLAEEVLETHATAMHWLTRPQLGLGEMIPLELLSTEIGAKEVEELLYRIEYGIYS